MLYPVEIKLVLEKSIDIKLAQEEKIEEPIVVKDYGNLISFKFIQLEKADESINIKLVLKFISIKFSQLEKQPLPNFYKDSGKFNYFNCLQ